MDSPNFYEQTYRRALGDGLVLRWSTTQDLEQIQKLYSFVFRDKADEPLNQHIAAWVRDLMSNQHPLLSAEDFAIVEDTTKGIIVAATCLMKQSWSYAGISLPVGRPEIVATLPEYRNRGLIRAIFELMHARSEHRGDFAQGITGIHYYYRQFGYEYALDLGGGCNLPFTAIPKLKEDQTETYTLQPATSDDIPTVLDLYNQERAHMAISADIDAEYWRYSLDGHSPESGEGWLTFMIVDKDQETIGYTVARRLRLGHILGINGMYVKEGRSLAAVMPSVLRELQKQAENTAAWKPDSPPAAYLQFSFGRDHPVYATLQQASTIHRPPYAWYVRVPDLPAFIHQITSVLEQRIADSIFAGHTGELLMDFYRGGLRLAFESGKLTTVENWQRDHNWGKEAQCGFPPQVFLQLLFGHRSLAELRHAFMDVWATDDGRPLLEVLFPPQLAWVTTLD